MTPEQEAFVLAVVKTMVDAALAPIVARVEALEQAVAIKEMALATPRREATETIH